MSLTQESLNITLDEMIRDLLLAMVSSQNEANKSFIAGIDDLAGTDVVISYKKNVGDKTENREIRGNALAFGIVPVLLQIQSGIIEIKTALTIMKNTAKSNPASKSVKSRTGYLFKSEPVDAKYQNTYSFKAEASSTVRITVVPTPPPQPLIEAIRELTEAAPPINNVKT